LLLFLTAIGFSPGGSSLTPVQTPQYNNTYINGTAQLQYTHWQFTHTIQCAYTNTNIPTQLQYTHNYNVPTATIYPQLQYTHSYNIPTTTVYPLILLYYRITCSKTDLNLCNSFSSPHTTNRNCYFRKLHNTIKNICLSVCLSVSLSVYRTAFTIHMLFTSHPERYNKGTYKEMSIMRVDMRVEEEVRNY
jgi:hypothetical protein